MKTPASPSSSSASQAALLNAIFISSQDAIISLSTHGIIEAWNPAAEKHFGYIAREVIGKKISLLVSPNLLPKSHLSTTGLHGPGKPHICIGKRKDKSTFDISVTLSPIETGDEEAPAYVFIIKPVLTPAQEKESESLLHAIFENVEEGFVLLDRGFRIRMFNSNAYGSIVLNQKNKEVKKGNSIFDYIDDDRKDFFRAVLNEVLAGKPYKYDRSFVNSDSKVFWFQFSLNPVLENGEITGVCLTGNNISERKLAEQKAEENERRFRGMVENSGDAVSILSADRKQLYTSPSIDRVLGYTESQSLNKDFCLQVHPDDLIIIKETWEKVLDNPGVPFYDVLYRVKNSANEWRWINSTLTNLLNDDSIKGVVHNFRDITDAVEAKENLRLSEERYRYLFYNNPAPMWIFDPATLNFLEVNNAATEKYGYTREEFLKLSLLNIHDIDDAINVWKSVYDRKGKTYNQSVTWKHFTKEKKILYVNICSHSFRYKGIDAVLVLVNDITEKNKADQLLLKAYDEKTKILESITDGFLTLDNNWIVTYWNKEAERILDMPRENIVGKNIWEVYEAAVPYKFYNEYHRAVKEKIPVSFEEYFPPYNMWVEVSAYPSAEGLSVYFKDITEKKFSQEKIRLTKERYEMVAKATNDAIYEWDILNNVTYWGEGFQTLFGHPRSDDAMPEESWQDNLHPDEKEGLLAIVRGAFEKKQTSLTRELRFRCADDTYKVVFDKLNILYDENGRPSKIVGAMQDITDRKNSEVAIRELNEQLNRRAEELVRSNEELDRFAYVASHDLQEPLRMVGSFLQLLQKKYRGQLDQTAHQYIGFAVDGSLRMKKLIQDLLEYARVGTNKEEFTSLNMNSVIQGIIKNYTGNSSQVVFSVGSLPVINANKIQVEQLLDNLVSNAVKYNTSDSPVVGIGCEEKTEEWEFFVKDNGIGIEEKFLDKVFVIFQRLHNKSRFPGTGIGLAICKKIVERHSGRIWIQSKPGAGSTFFFTIKK